jgi:hypothetical protein
MAKLVNFFMLAFLLGSLGNVQANQVAPDQEIVQVQESQSTVEDSDDFAAELEDLSLDLVEEEHKPSWPAVQAVKNVFTKVGIQVLLGIVAVKEYFSGE